MNGKGRQVVIEPGVVVVDVANVMGSRHDGWWRDRAGAAERLGREVVALARQGDGTSEWVLVFEGRARAAVQALTEEIAGSPVRLVPAPGIADDTIVSTAAEIVSQQRTCQVITADRELRARCKEAGATVIGPRWLLRQL
ncbi:MAG: hypothetical protein ACRDOI_45685 [Trebonia sp.]